MITPTAGARTRSRPGTVLVVLYTTYLLSFADRILFSLALQPIKAHFGFSEVQLGLLAGLAFAISYALFSPVAGWFADRRSRKSVLIIAVLLWSLATLATAFASSFATMFAARALVGAGEAAVMPLAVSMLSDAYDPARRAHAFAGFLSAGAAGTMLALLFGGALMATVEGWGGLDLPLVGTVLPWQSLFCVAGVLGLVFSLFVAVAMRDPPRSDDTMSDDAATGGVWRFVRTHPMLVTTLYLGLSFYQMATVTAVIWFVAAFARAHGVAPGRAGVMIGATAGLALLIGCVGAGVVVARRRASGRGGSLLNLCLAGSLAYGVLLIAGLTVHGTMIALVLIALGQLFGYVPTVTAFTMMGETVPAAIRARLAGFNTMANAIIANSLGAGLVGVFAEHLYAGPAATAEALATVIALGVVVGTAVTLLGVPAYRARLRLSGQDAHG